MRRPSRQVADRPEALFSHELAADEVNAASVHSREETHTSIKSKLVPAALPVHEVVVRLPRLAELRVGLAGRAAEAFYVRRFLKAGARAVCPSDQRERGGAQGLCLWRTTTRRFVCDDGKKVRGGEGPRWEKYDRACPRREWVPEDVRDDMVLEEIAKDCP